MPTKVDWYGDRFRRAVTLGSERLLTALGIGFQSEVKSQLNKLASNRSKGGKPSPPGQPPAKMTGNLGRSIQIGAIKSTPTGMKIQVGAHAVYARIHEFGGTIKAKKGSLTIPIHPLAVKASQQGVSARNIKGLSYVKTKRGGLLVKAKKKFMEVWYVLKKSVTMPKRPYFRPAMEVYNPKVQGIGERTFVRTVREVMRGA